MAKVKDFKWNVGMSVADLVGAFGNVGFQSVELKKSADLIVKMKKNNARIFLTFTSNMVTSGLRGFFAQLIELGLANVLVTTVGGIEEDIMKSLGEDFPIGKFDADDVELHEQGVNRVGNLMITSESYMKFEDWINPVLQKLYDKKKRWCVSEMLREIGLMIGEEFARDLGGASREPSQNFGEVTKGPALKDNENNSKPKNNRENSQVPLQIKSSILYQAAKNNVPIFCPAITDGGFGFHLYLFQQKHKDFIVDVVEDFGNILLSTNYDEKKAVIALGGSISKHHAILATLLNGGAEYALYMTTAHKTSGSMSGATTSEAKSWGKVKDDSDVATVIGDVTIMFPLAMIAALDELKGEGLI